MYPRKLFITFFFLLPGFVLLEANVLITISGFVRDSNGRGIELAYVKDSLTKQTVTTDEDGYYSITLPARDTVVLYYHCLSYQPAIRFIPVGLSNMMVNVTLSISSRTLNEVVVQGQQRQTDSFDKLSLSNIRLQPDPSGGSIESMLATLPGVSSHQELSTQYSVRGGSYDENLVYVNGIEIYRPLLIRAGQQEGLSFINPEMVREVRFSAGGYDVRYGDKMSSVLDIDYKKPVRSEATISAGLLGGSLYLGQASRDGRFTQLHGLRYKTNNYLLGTLETKGEYRPSFLDYQTYLTWKPTPSDEWSLLGNYSSNRFQFVPETRQTEFGTYRQKYTLTVYFDGQEKDLFETFFGALTYKKTWQKQLETSLQVSFFRTDEEENYDITGQYWLSETPIQSNREDSTGSTLIGVGTYHEHARNHLMANVVNASHHGNWKLDGHTIQWGIAYQLERINDHIREWEMRDSAGYSIPYSDEHIRLVNTMSSAVEMNSHRLTGYLQDTWRHRNESGLWLVHAGLRLNHWSFNGETLWSPRFSATFLPVWKKNVTFRLAGGVYYQAPFYKELRDTVQVNGLTAIRLNRSIKAPRSLQAIGGMDYHFIWEDRPFKFTAEAYYKDLSRLIPYTVDNVRVRYSGENSSSGYTTGLDFKLFGEFVPGTDSWISLSFMRSRELIEGILIPRPNEQRYQCSIFFQDYFPTDPHFTMSLKVIWADGLPFGPPDLGKQFATLRMPPYRRVDIGMSRSFSPVEDSFMKAAPLKWIQTAWIGIDCFNLLAIKNVNSYYWVNDVAGNQWAVPNYLTGRLLNLRLTATF